jgi:hypothetical protein
MKWSDVTIRQFYEAQEVINGEYEDELERSIALLCAVTGQTEIEILSLTHNEIAKLSKELSFLNSLDTMGKEWPKWFMVQGRLFKPLRDIRKITGGQLIELLTFSKEPLQNIHKILATLSLPCNWIGKARKYDADKHNEISELFREHLTMDIAYPIAVFFCNLWEELLKNIQDYLEGETLKTIQSLDSTQAQALLSRLSDGYTQSISSQEGTEPNGSTISG